MATAASRVSSKNGGENREKLAKPVAQQLRNDLHMISNEARKKHPAVREVSLTRLGLGGKLVQLTLPILSPNLLPRLYRQLNEAPCVSKTSLNWKALLFKVFRHTVCVHVNLSVCLSCSAIGYRWQYPSSHVRMWQQEPTAGTAGTLCSTEDHPVQRHTPGTIAAAAAPSAGSPSGT